MYRSEVIQNIPTGISSEDSIRLSKEYIDHWLLERVILETAEKSLSINDKDFEKKIKQFREQTSIPVFFTLDAGPNVHVLYPDEVESQVNAFIQNELKPYCNEGRIIRDKVGTGPEKIS